MVATRSSVEPHLKLVGTIFGYFCTLCKEHLLGIVVGVVAVGVFFAPIFTVAVPGRDVEAILQAQVLGSCRKIPGYVGFLCIGIAAIHHVMSGSLGRPQTETVVVLYYGYTTAHTASLDGFEPLARIRHSSRCKNAFVFAAVAPFLVGVGVHAIVEEGVELRLVPLELALCGNGKYRTRFVVSISRLFVDQGKFRTLCVAGKGGCRHQAKC